MNNELDNKCKQYTESLDLLLDKHENFKHKFKILISNLIKLLSKMKPILMHLLIS